MDDIRRPQAPARRDYALPHRPHPSAPRQIPVNEPAHHTHEPTHHHHHHQPQPATSQPVQAAEQPYYQPVQRPALAADFQPAPSHTRRKKNLKPVLLIALPFAAAAIFAAGYSLKPSKAETGIPVKIVKQAPFNVYFPSPMPPGYKYMSETATFQIGSVFYKFASGNKRVTVREEPAPQSKPDLSLLSGYTRLNFTIGQAAIGSNFGQPVAVVVTPTTVITLNTSGGVNPDDLKTAINNFKNIGQNTQKSS